MFCIQTGGIYANALQGSAESSKGGYLEYDRAAVRFGNIDRGEVLWPDEDALGRMSPA